MTGTTNRSDTTKPYGLKDAMSAPRACQWCGLMHGPRCPSVAAIEYHPDGSVRRVEFVQPQPVAWTACRVCGHHAGSGPMGWACVRVDCPSKAIATTRAPDGATIAFDQLGRRI